MKVGLFDFPYKNEASLLLGISFLETDDLNSALSAFREVSPGSSLYADAQWYQALTYVKTGDTASALRILNEINETNPERKEASAEIIKYLKNQD